MLHSRDMNEGKFTATQTLSASYGLGCSGGNISPQLSWENAPKGTKSFVLIMSDEDAPTGIGWTHWVVANIPSTTSEINAGSGGHPQKLPNGAQETLTDFGEPGYTGPCPQKGQIHRYVMTLYALNVEKLNVEAKTMPALMRLLVKQNSIGLTSITALQSR